MKFILIISTIFLSLNSFAEIDRKGNGGDTYAIEFVDVAYKVISQLKIQNDDILLTNRIEDVVKAAKVDSTDELLFLNMVKKDAINYPNEKRIVFNRKAWSSNLDERNKMLFVLHEYLGLLSVDDSRYSVSVKLLKSVYKDSVVCYSLAQNSYAGGAFTGRAAINLSGRNEVTWRDSLFTYSLSVNGHSNPAFFLLAVYDNESKKIYRVQTNLEKSNPYFESLWSINTSELVGGYPITDMTVECR